VGSGPELAKLYYRIGEVAQIVGVQPHVLRYWESEFRTIRPRKSSKGQRVYSRRDVEKLLRVKDLLKNQGFTIAGAKRKLRDPAAEPAGAAELAPAPEVAPVSPLSLASPVAAPTAVPIAHVANAPPRPPGAAMTRVHQSLVALRADLVAMLRELGDD
jgi:DNA-binding transcriptional MerR regulator